MCGIVALFSRQEPISETSLKRGIDSLHHRGPDAQKVWISEDGRVGLGHRRLSIIDLTSGDQPISDRDGTLHIVANGEFYDFERIQQDLKQKGYKLQTHSDSEIAIHLYNEFGTQCLHHLRGEFAFVIWDERNQTLFAARDRFGIKPLYYTMHGDTLYLASEVKALFAAGVPANWDSEFWFRADLGLFSPDRTFFKNIYQVPPGHFLLASRTNIQLHRYWDFDYPNNDVQPQQSEEDYIQQVRHSLNESIRLRLRADVPVACHVSGGIDSSAVLGIAATHTSEPITAFTLAFDHEDYNEEVFAREAVAKAGANHEIVPITQSDLAEHFADAIWHCEMVCINAGAAAKYLLSRAVQKAGYKVVLTGEGADEIFGGYVHFLMDMLRYNTKGQDEQTIKHILEELKRNNQVSAAAGFLPEEISKPLANIERLLGFVPTWIEANAKGYAKSLSLYSPEFLAHFGQRDAYRIFFNEIDVQGQLAKREPVHQSLYLWSKTVLPYLFRILGDGAEMAHSTEGRLPFLDHELVETVRNIPVSLKIRGMNVKYILREAAKPYLPDMVYNRKKHPFFAPPSTLKQNEPLHQLVQDTLRSSAFASVPFYNQPAVVQFLDQIPHMNENQLGSIDPTLMKMLSTCILQERFVLT
ncbi:MAG: asparagine synthase (glutamine-hydrolyzing) [Nostoc sp. ChiSLP02]|nr:asparagine synthase (glutamine-hydrolyzing) [Nostoc sp. DedSLP05]MDZ8103943.1 asparagine synthase (glutamine-hydrolyzing) [Nostoc sp. DedSLP01]MDZ8187163.1 asparagine synthase (glutamine-hydrolyzing) [Nostoc sp. ChiSLP02]